MTELLIQTDTFNRSSTIYGAAGTTTGVGNNWTDVAGNDWKIGTVSSVQTLQANNLNVRYRQYLLRPSSEDIADARITVSYIFNNTVAYNLVRVNRSTFDAYGAYFDGSFRLNIVRINGAAQTETSLGLTSLGHALTVGTEYNIDLKVVGTTLTATLATTAAPATILVSVTVTDSGLTGAGGVGVTNFFGTNISAISTYNESAPASTGYTFVGPTSGIVNAASTPFTVALTPAGSIPPGTTVVTPSDGGGGGSFSPATISLSPGTQSATFTYTPTTSGVKTLSVTNNQGFTNPSTISYTANAAALVAGVISTTSVGPTTVGLSATASTGGTGALAYQWYRSTTGGFIPGAGNILAGATSRTLSDTGLTPNTVYFYKLVTTDSLSVTATTPQYPVVTNADATAFVLGFIGDSISIYTPNETTTAGGTLNPPGAFARYLSILTGERPVTVVDRAVAGQTSTSWLPGTGQYIAAKAAFASAGVTHVFIMLGINDSKNDTATTPATYKSNMSAIFNDLVSSGYKVIVNMPTYAVPGSFAGVFDEAATGLVQQYMAQLLTLIDGVNILIGDTVSFEWFAANPGELVDGLHPSVHGAHTLARLWLAASAAYLLPIGPLFVNRGGAPVTLTPFRA